MSKACDSAAESETEGETPKRKKHTDGESDRETPERERGGVLSVEREKVFRQ